MAREEGLFVGWSCGSAVYGALEYARKHLSKEDMMVIIMPDHGTRYLGKIYNDNWMKDHGYVESIDFANARDIIKKRSGNGKLVTVEAKQSVGEAIQKLHSGSISQLPVIEGNNFVGSLTDSKILRQLIENPELRDTTVAEVMDPPFQFVAMDNTLDVLSSLINKDNKALLVRDEQDQVHIITQHDLLMAMTQ